MGVLQKGKRIADLPRLSRPREKLVANGSSNLTNAELLAILFNTGSAKGSALTLGETVLRKYPVRTLGDISTAHLTSIPGIGMSKATRLIAALELGKRIYEQDSLTKQVIRSLDDTIQVIKEYAEKKQEYLLCLYLNARHELLQKEVIGVGTLNSLQIEPKEVFRPALTTPCASIIVAHNHPSGDPTPSEDDIHFTSRIQEAGEIMGISLIDHVIISKNNYFSFRENKTA